MATTARTPTRLGVPTGVLVAAICAFVLASGAIGYLLGTSSTTSARNVTQARVAAEHSAAAKAQSTAAATARQHGYSQGLSAGRAEGKRAAAAAGARDGQAEGARRAQTAAQAAGSSSASSTPTPGRPCDGPGGSCPGSFNYGDQRPPVPSGNSNYPGGPDYSKIPACQGTGPGVCPD